MIDSFSVRLRNRYSRILSIPIFAMSLFLAAIFIASAGTRATPLKTQQGTYFNPLQHPYNQNPVPAEQPGVVDQPAVVEEPKVSFKTIFSLSRRTMCRCGVPRAPGAGGLNLSEYDTFRKGGNGGAAFDAGNGKGSLVVKRIDGGGMPPIPPPLEQSRSSSSLTGLMRVPRTTKPRRYHNTPAPFCQDLKLPRLLLYFLKGASIIAPSFFQIPYIPIPFVGEVPNLAGLIKY